MKEKERAKQKRCVDPKAEAGLASSNLKWTEPYVMAQATSGGGPLSLIQCKTLALLRVRWGAAVFMSSVDLTSLPAADKFHGKPKSTPKVGIFTDVVVTIQGKASLVQTPHLSCTEWYVLRGTFSRSRGPPPLHALSSVCSGEKTAF